MISDGRLEIVPIAPEVLAGLLRGHEINQLTTDWPDDAMILDVQIDYRRVGGPILLKVHSATFPIAAEGTVLMDWTPTMTVTTPDRALASLLELLGKMKDA